MIPEHAYQAEFAIVMTSFARDFLLDEAIWSIRNQTYQDWALYIIDDNSDRLNPMTRRIIAQHAIEDSRIVPIFRKDVTWEYRRRVCWVENINLVLEDLVDRNMCRYVVYSTCDDYKYKEQLEVLREYLDKYPVVVARLKVVVAPDWHIDQGLPYVPRRTGWMPRGLRVGEVDHNGISHQLDILQKLRKPFWPSHPAAPDGLFAQKIARWGAFVPAQILGEKRRHRNSIHGQYFGWERARYG